MKSSADLRVLLNRLTIKVIPRTKTPEEAISLTGMCWLLTMCREIPLRLRPKSGCWFRENRPDLIRAFMICPGNAWRCRIIFCGGWRKQSGSILFRPEARERADFWESVSRGRRLLDRSACVIEPENGTITLRMEIGFPANGRTINARELEKILFDFCRSAWSRPFLPEPTGRRN